MADEQKKNEIDIKVTVRDPAPTDVSKTVGSREAGERGQAAMQDYARMIERAYKGL